MRLRPTLINVDSINVDGSNPGHQSLSHGDPLMSEPLTAIEAAARLGVKRETLYAYVSRGLLDRTLSLDGRTSLFDARQVDQLRTSRRRPARGELRTVITTGITELDEAGHRYRGIPIAELTNSGFETVADLIWGHQGDWAGPIGLHQAVSAIVTQLPDATPPIDRLRVAIAVASGLDPLRYSPAPAAQAAAGRSMVSACTFALGAAPPRPANEPASVATNLMLALSAADAGPVDPADVARAVDLALVLLADHGLAASTFSARIAASVRADPYSIVAAGMGPVGGQLHGAASLGVHQLFLDVATHGQSDAIGRQLASGQRFPGVGHTIYVEVDPREVLLRSLIEEIWAGDPRLETVTSVQAALQEHVDLVTNIDFALGALTWLMGAPPWAGEVIFAAARIVGWIAHGIEEFSEKPVRFRPSARYVGLPDPAALETP